MSDLPHRAVRKGQEKTYTETILSGGSVTLQMVDTTMEGTKEGWTFFTPKNAHEARTPLGILSGAYTPKEIYEARQVGAVSLGAIGQMISGGEVIYLSYAPLNNAHETTVDPRLGVAQEVTLPEGKTLEVQHDPRLLAMMRDGASQNPFLREDGFFPDHEIQQEGRPSGERK